ncbi:hypothetical protein EXN66_Car013633 [Channa argus]|uniref:Reverse transcriptase domain-containing protein n=1 Tax=Channa argus TaxID=215402 RepID=A0A6G1Q616_CHAAH|nr:hypothetical protein EXN66_Car013633 [Channa argus]KAK2899782.1 hypothetical protein Q8A73_012911 [Channa argus]
MERVKHVGSSQEVQSNCFKRAAGSTGKQFRATRDAQHALADYRYCVERTNPEALIIVLRDFAIVVAPIKRQGSQDLMITTKTLQTPLHDPLHVNYRVIRSVDDAVNMAPHFILQHLGSPGSYNRILFVDFSSAFNTIVPPPLKDRLSQLNVPHSMCIK